MSDLGDRLASTLESDSTRASGWGTVRGRDGSRRDCAISKFASGELPGPFRILGLYTLADRSSALAPR